MERRAGSGELRHSRRGIAEALLGSGRKRAGATPSLFLNLPSPEDESGCVAFTDGSRWSWYRNSGHGSELVPLDDPPPSPASPLGQRWLEPVWDKRNFKNILRAMNVALRDSHGGGIVERFDVIGKVLFTKVFDEREVREGDKDRYELYAGTDDTLESLAERADAVWKRACARHEGLYHGGVPKLTEDRPALRRMVEILQDVDLLETRGDIKGLAYEETLRNTFDKNENQQFFTPHELVEFIVELAAPARDEVICDPACGTGGFLVEACVSARANEGVVGAEVDARLAQVAQMNLMMHGADRATVHHLPGLGSLAPLQELTPDLPEGSVVHDLPVDPVGRVAVLVGDVEVLADRDEPLPHRVACHMHLPTLLLCRHARIASRARNSFYEKPRPVNADV